MVGVESQEWNGQTKDGVCERTSPKATAGALNAAPSCPWWCFLVLSFKK